MLIAREHATPATSPIDHRRERHVEIVEPQRRPHARLEGLDAGRKEGQAAGLRTGILDLCEVLGVPLTPADHAELEALDADALTQLRDQIKRERRFR